MKTYQTLEEAQRFQKIKETLALDPKKASWQWLCTFSPPECFNHGIGDLKALLHRFCECLKDHEKAIILTGVANIVIRPGSPPHVHLLLTSLPSDHGTTLDQIDHKKAIQLYWPFKGHIHPEKAIDHRDGILAEQMADYVAGNTNLFIDGRIGCGNDWFYYRKSLYEQLIQTRS